MIENLLSNGILLATQFHGELRIYEGLHLYRRMRHGDCMVGLRVNEFVMEGSWQK